MGERLKREFNLTFENQPLLKTEIPPPDGRVYKIIDGIYAKDEVISGIKAAMNVIENARPDKIITIGGNCIVSKANVSGK